MAGTHKDLLRDQPADFRTVLDIKGSFELAIAFSKLFWPDFVRVDGCVLVAKHYRKQEFEEWKRELAGDCVKMEQVINHLHIFDLFPNDDMEDVDPSKLEYLARFLIKSWSCALVQAFPDQAFDFDYATDPDTYGPTITFWQRT